MYLNSLCWLILCMYNKLLSNVLWLWIYKAIFSFSFSHSFYNSFYRFWYEFAFSKMPFHILPSLSSFNANDLTDLDSESRIRTEKWVLKIKGMKRKEMRFFEMDIIHVLSWFWKDVGFCGLVFCLIFCFKNRIFCQFWLKTIQFSYPSCIEGKWQS